MAETLYKDTTYTVSLLVQSIGLGKVALPDIQRPFVWQAAKVRALFDSMYKGFPVGYLLFWARPFQDRLADGRGGVYQVAA